MGAFAETGHLMAAMPLPPVFRVSLSVHPCWTLEQEQAALLQCRAHQPEGLKGSEAAAAGILAVPAGSISWQAQLIDSCTICLGCCRAACQARAHQERGSVPCRLVLLRALQFAVTRSLSGLQRCPRTRTLLLIARIASRQGAATHSVRSAGKECCWLHSNGRDPPVSGQHCKRAHQAGFSMLLGHHLRRSASMPTSPVHACLPPHASIPRACPPIGLLERFSTRSDGSPSLSQPPQAGGSPPVSRLSCGGRRH